MTSVKFMQANRAARHGWRVSILLVFAAAAAVLASGCAPRERLTPPMALRAPYAAPRVWAVAPFNNESGVSRIDMARMADLFAQEVEQADGLRALPVNRVLAAMEALRMPALTSDADALALLDVLGVDGLVAGTITSYEAYEPLTLGLAVQLYSRSGGPAGGEIDHRALMRSASGEAVEPFDPGDARAIVASGVFDAANHTTLEALRMYAQGRTAPGSAYGERIYLVSMDFYTRFVSHRLIGDLLAGERQRLAASAAEMPPPP